MNADDKQHEIVTLKEHFEVLLAELEKRIEQKFAEHDKALILTKDNSRNSLAMLLALVALAISLFPFLRK